MLRKLAMNISEGTYKLVLKKTKYEKIEIVFRFTRTIEKIKIRRRIYE